MKKVVPWTRHIEAFPCYTAPSSKGEGRFPLAYRASANTFLLWEHGGLFSLYLVDPGWPWFALTFEIEMYLLCSTLKGKRARVRLSPTQRL